MDKEDLDLYRYDDEILKTAEVKNDKNSIRYSPAKITSIKNMSYQMAIQKMID